MVFTYPNLLGITILLLLPVLGCSLTLVSDVSTPSFLVDMDMLKKAATTVGKESSKPIPLYLPKYKKIIAPYLLGNRSELIADVSSQINPEDAFDVSQYSGQQSALGYLHSSVTRARETKGESDGDEADQSSDSSETYLAELDLSINLTTPRAQLVMGINNHHVGSYYWARSAGMGASMEAPGILFRESKSDHLGNNDKAGELCWQGDGPLECNSNDGKRSEWVNFLRVGDLVQLLPECFEDDIMSFVERYQDGDSSDNCRIYGFSSKHRPLGSEPVVTCEWRAIETLT
jgi:hypothetical protein